MKRVDLVKVLPASKLEWGETLVLIILTLIGAESMNSVIKYDENGYADTLPSLIESRRDHACGHYIDNAGEEVRCGIETRCPGD